MGEMISRQLIQWFIIPWHAIPSTVGVLLADEL